jgi:CheY-like chemotaxis protein
MPAPGSSAPVELLLVEDSPDDADLMKEALDESDFRVRVNWVEDGEDALRYLRRLPPFGDAPRPDLVLLDLHLPRLSGHEVLAEIKEDEGLRRIPVIVLTSADSELAFLSAYELHANCCVRKPADLEQFAVTVKKIEHFWLRVASRLRG